MSFPKSRMPTFCSNSSTIVSFNLREKVRARAQAFFVALQLAARDWIALGATKTRVVYRLTGSLPPGPRVSRPIPIFASP